MDVRFRANGGARGSCVGGVGDVEEKALKAGHRRGGRGVCRLEAAALQTV